MRKAILKLAEDLKPSYIYIMPELYANFRAKNSLMQTSDKPGGLLCTREGFWLECIHAAKPDKPDIYHPISKTAAVVWLLENNYIGDHSEIQWLLERYPKNYLPTTDKIIKARMEAIRDEKISL